jgi:hypothetical protein
LTYSRQTIKCKLRGGVAQLGERLDSNIQEVISSNLFTSTIFELQGRVIWLCLFLMFPLSQT